LVLWEVLLLALGFAKVNVVDGVPTFHVLKVDLLVPVPTSAFLLWAWPFPALSPAWDLSCGVACLASLFPPLPQ